MIGILATVEGALSHSTNRLRTLSVAFQLAATD